MKLIKLKQDHFIGVDDSEIKEGDYYIRLDNNLMFSTLKGSNPHIVEKYCKKITHSTQPLDVKITDEGIHLPDWSKVKALSSRVVKELIGEVDVEKKVKDYVEELIDCKSVKESERTWISAICYQMYNQALEDNKEKKYTEAQMRECWRASERFDRPSNEGYAPNFEEFIQSLQPKTEWEVEIIDGKLKLKF